MRFLIPAALLALTACTPEPAPVTGSLPFFGDGYRFKGDACRRLGESPETAEYLDHTADLVGCPEGLENLGVFVTDSGAQEVARQDGYILYSVPRG
ncbi:hypothetical protein [Sulfitobacter sp. MF3-043]|uniref:hypothetical protein n=1 Tax=Sulfitobacter sediminivivens TaxID=3252902 RepID=UPI003EC07765